MDPLLDVSVYIKKEWPLNFKAAQSWNLFINLKFYFTVILQHAMFCKFSLVYNIPLPKSRFE